jgi:hypothetical protein
MPKATRVLEIFTGGPKSDPYRLVWGPDVFLGLEHV